MKIIYLITLIIYLLVQIEAAKILAVFPFPSISHQVVFRPLVLELVNRGHEVVFITPDPAFPKGQAPLNLTEVDVHDKLYETWRDIFISKPHESHDMVNNMKSLYNSIVHISDALFQDTQVLDIIKDENKRFDLLLIEACIRPMLIFTHIFKAPAIQISSFTGVSDNFRTMGLSTHPILYPGVTRQRLYNLTLWEKITELFNDYLIENAFYEIEEEENNVIKHRLGSTMPRLSELYQNVDMILLNSHPVFEGIRPVTPSTVYIGGIHQKPEKNLPEDLKSYLDFANEGVIYVSFGTNVDPSKFPPEKIRILLRVFSRLPYDVLWRWNKDELPGKADNIKFFKWLPQSDLLRHPNVKLFIMQGGLQSIDEAITAGVPLIGIPRFGDQWFNVENLVRRKIGIRLDLEDINEEMLKTAITTILEDDSYRQNIVKLRNYIEDQPQKPLERAVWWMEYVLRHGGAKHLKSPSANITWWVYLELDLVFVLLGILLAVISFVIITLYLLLGFMISSFSQTFKIKIS